MKNITLLEELKKNDKVEITSDQLNSKKKMIEFLNICKKENINAKYEIIYKINSCEVYHTRVIYTDINMVIQDISKYSSNLNYTTTGGYKNGTYYNNISHSRKIKKLTIYKNNGEITEPRVDIEVIR